MDGFLLNFIFENFSNICRENITFTKMLQGTLHKDQFTFLIISHSVILTMRNVSKIVEKIRTNILGSITSFSKIVSFIR